MAILVISMHAERALVRLILDAGANGYILKDDRLAIMELATIIRLLHQGGFYLSQKIAHLVKSASGKEAHLLSSRQLEVFSYLASQPDISTAQIAEKLNIAPSTVRNLLSGAYLKLEVSNRTAALARLRQLELLPPDGV